MGFLKTILIIILGYYLLKLLARWIAPWLFAYAARKTEEHLRDRFEAFREQHRVAGDEPKPAHNKDSKKVGEYIEFEEIE